MTHLPGARLKGHLITAACPFCSRRKDSEPGKIAVQMNPESAFRGYFRCLKRCVPGGFHFHFGRLMKVAPEHVPGFDPDDEGYVLGVQYPTRHLQAELEQFAALMGEEQLRYFADHGISRTILKEMRIGFNGRYLIYPYIQENGNAYAARCVMPYRAEDHFWHGNQEFSTGEFRVFNAQEIQRCEGGALFVTEGELNLLILRELGYPAIAVPFANELASMPARRLGRIEHIFLLVHNAPEARLAAREMAVRLGFKARILNWPADAKRGGHLSDLVQDSAENVKNSVALMIKQSRSFSPFSSPEREISRLASFLENEHGKTLLGLETGFAQLDQAVEGLRGINIMGGPPKAGKSCFFMQISTQVAQNKTPVIYYDFENGRQKIYLRTLVRLSTLTEKKIRQGQLDTEENKAFRLASKQLDDLLNYFRVVTDRQLTAETMRRHIDFIKHETKKDELLVVIDSLHKLPFKSLSERRTGIDSWLRHFEAIRDEQQVCFLVISELSRAKGGGYGERPDLSSFKESGDIEYSADNAMILSPNWDPLEAIASQSRKSILWMVASRESNPGRIAEYELDYPFWRFKEI